MRSDWAIPVTRGGYTRRGYVSLATGTAGAALLGAACGPVGGGPGAPPTPSELTAELTWAAPGATISDEQQKVLDNFKARYPKVRVTYNPSADAVVFYAFLISSTAAGTPRDIQALHTFVVPEQAERGVLGPLDDFIKRDRREVNPDD